MIDKNKLAFILEKISNTLDEQTTILNKITDDVSIIKTKQAKQDEKLNQILDNIVINSNSITKLENIAYKLSLTDV